MISNLKSLNSTKDGARVVPVDGKVSFEPEKAEEVELPELFNGLTKEEVLEELQEVDGVTEAYALAFFNMGIYGVDMLQSKAIDDLTPIKGLGEVTAKKILDSAAEFEVDEE